MAISNISIIIEVRNKASRQVKRVEKDVKRLRGELKQFNRNLFTATALFGTFMIGFRKAADLTKVGAQFQFFREQFQHALGADFLITLRTASREMIDHLSLMRTSLQAHAAGLSKGEIADAATLSVGAAKLLGKTASQSFDEITKALRTYNPAAFASYLTTLKGNNQFQILNKVIGSVTKNLGSAGLKWEVFRKIALQQLSAAMSTLADDTDSALDILMKSRSAFNSLRQTVGELLARAFAPLVQTLVRYMVPAVDKLFVALSATEGPIARTRDGLINFIQVMGVASASVMALWTSFHITRMLMAPFGITMGKLALIIGAAYVGLRALRNEGETWAQVFSRVGTIVKFVTSAFFSYKDGVITISSELHDRFMMLSEGQRDFVVNLARAAVFIKNFFMGVIGVINSVANAISNVVGMIGKVFQSVFGIGGGSIIPRGFIEDIPKLLGTLAGIGGIGALGFKALGGTLFKRGSSPFMPLYVKDVANPFQMFGRKDMGPLAAFRQMFDTSKMTMLGKTLAWTMGPILALSIGLAIGTILEDHLPKLWGSDKKLSDAITDNVGNGANAISRMDLANQMGSVESSDVSSASQKAISGAIKTNFNKVPDRVAAILQQMLEDGKLTRLEAVEANELLRNAGINMERIEENTDSARAQNNLKKMRLGAL